MLLRSFLLICAATLFVGLSEVSSSSHTNSSDSKERHVVVPTAVASKLRDDLNKALNKLPSILKRDATTLPENVGPKTNNPLTNAFTPQKSTPNHQVDPSVVPTISLAQKMRIKKREEARKILEEIMKRPPKYVIKPPPTRSAEFYKNPAVRNANKKLEEIMKRPPKSVMEPSPKPVMEPPPKPVMEPPPKRSAEFYKKPTVRDTNKRLKEIMSRADENAAPV
ncbi:RxLR-like protein [Plasmopara halstedii]|uniref:RxLR-like protein n=1 Tax=Plasmopara halstedii TaxID=4781 RepID=A0A0N7L7S6_PLAHL|nr:RxLR-like protein [Plasmopara halstedii]CEG47899.1 RxLR-like protein [Plasmopara halstedii]|eukprot:XP_024584268.1 RxLR-like protein [Plasmopara halstedii]